MLEFVNTLLAFIVAIGILVTIHEFGHFWVAKKLGIKVLRFSVGFGKILKSWHWGETQYTICAIPLGGFVKMLDENEDDVDEAEKHRAFNRQSVYARIAVVVAGPAANFILAILLYTFIFTVGITGVKPVVGLIENNSIAQQSGIQTGDKLLSINNGKTPSISEFSQHFLGVATQPKFNLKVLSNTDDLKTLSVHLSGDFLAKPEQGIEQYLGFKFALPTFKPIIDKISIDKAAYLAGIKSGDQIIKANNKPIETWRDFVTIIKQNSNQEINLQVLRGRQLINLLLTPKNENDVAKAGVSLQIPENYLDGWQVVIKKDPVDAFLSANIRVYQLSMLNLIVIKKMILGDTSIKQINSPISIANYAGKTAKTGLIPFLSFLALISIGLGLLNLLPIPLLDGGHLFFYMIEIFKGSALSQKSQQIFMKLGLLLILSLTFVAMYNDVLRLL